MFFWSQVSPILARPVPSSQLTRWVAVTFVPSSETLAPSWIALLDSHFGVSVADCLALTALAGSDYELLWPPRGTPRAVTG